MEYFVWTRVRFPPAPQKFGVNIQISGVCAFLLRIAPLHSSGKVRMTKVLKIEDILSYLILSF